MKVASTRQSSTPVGAAKDEAGLVLMNIADGLGRAGVEPVNVCTVVDAEMGSDSCFVTVNEACYLCEVKRPVAGVLGGDEVRVD
jgi:hypothetical protein